MKQNIFNFLLFALVGIPSCTTNDSKIQATDITASGKWVLDSAGTANVQVMDYRLYGAAIWPGKELPWRKPTEQYGGFWSAVQRCPGVDPVVHLANQLKMVTGRACLCDHHVCVYRHRPECGIRVRRPHTHAAGADSKNNLR